MPPAVSSTNVTGPSFTRATAIVAWKRPVATGRRVARAQATMAVALVNDGPVTFVLDTAGGI